MGALELKLDQPFVRPDPVRCPDNVLNMDRWQITVLRHPDRQAALIAWLDRIGVGADQCYEIELVDGGIRFSRFRHDEHGRPYLDPPVTGDIAREDVFIAGCEPPPYWPNPGEPWGTPTESRGAD